jgi:cell division septal protein FtsQ
VENAIAVPQPTILDAANVKAGRHLYSVGEAQIERRITASSPYVKSVTLKRKLPSTLRILI